MTKRKKRKKSVLPYISLFAGACIYISIEKIELAVVVSVAIFMIKPLGKHLKKCIRRKRYLRSSLAQIDQMKGHEFEEYLAEQFKQLGYSVRNMGAGGHDYGVDLVLGKDGNVIAVQAKRYNENVGIKAIQEIMSGMIYYDATHAMVITNSHFTSSAKKLAKKGNVELWDREVCRRNFKPC